MNNKKTFAIYCSGGASRVIKFYSNKRNLNHFSPDRIIYDGNDLDVESKLLDLFGNKMSFFKNENLSKNQKKRIHYETSNFIHKTLNLYQIEYLLCFGTKILKKDLVQDFSGRLINFHPSILPSFKGLNSIDKALTQNVVFLGNTAHFIETELDSGKIIIQTSMLTEDFEKYEDVLELQFPMIKMILRDLFNFTVSDKNLFSDLKYRKIPYSIPKKIQHK